MNIEEMPWVRRGGTRDVSGDICSVHIMREPESLSEGLDTESVGIPLEVLKQGSSTVRCAF